MAACYLLVPGNTGEKSGAIENELMAPKPTACIIVELESKHYVQRSDDIFFHI